MVRYLNRAKTAILNTSLQFKISILVLMAGILPSVIVLIISLNNLQRQYINQQLYAMNQGYEQALMSIKDKMDSAHNIALLLAVSDIYDTGTIFSQNTEDITQQLDNFNKINSYTYGMELAFDSCKVTYYIDDDFQIVNNFSSRFHSIEEIKNESWYKYLKNGTPNIWTSIDSKLSIAKNLYSSEDYTKKIGVLVVSLDKEAIKELLINSKEDQLVSIIDDSGNLLFSNQKGQYKKIDGQDIIKKSKEFQRVSFDNIDYYFRCNEIEQTGIYLSSIVPVASLEKEKNDVIIQMRLMYVGIAIIVLLMLAPITNMVTKRIKLIANTMKETKDSGLKKIEINDGNRDEISTLILQYNDMVDKLQVSLKEQYSLGEAKKDAELKALQSQINPHFLYNTLDMINWMAQKNEKDNIREVIQAMSKFYRMTLSKGEDIISIRDELKMCDAYMDIQKKRFKGRINYIQQVEDDVLDFLIPKITLQPLIENSIVHGINEKEVVRGTIRVDGWIEDNRITLSVTDDGVGMMQENIYKNNGSHYGMKNIAKRLEVFYDEKIELQIESTLGIGTCVIFNIPIKKNRKD